MSDVTLDQMEESLAAGLGGHPVRRRAAWLAAQLAAERDRWGLWLPVWLGSGIALYFGLRFEPWPWLGTLAAAGCLGLLPIARRSVRPRMPLLAASALPLGVLCAGFALAQIESWRSAAPVLPHPLGIVELDGRVRDLEVVTDGVRISIAPDRIGGVAVPLPEIVRVKLRRPPAALAVGDRVAMKASLMPPPGPAMPGGFDFQRQAWFRGIGGVGYAVGTVEITQAEPDGLHGWLRALRGAMTARIRAALPPQTGGIAAALITGERGAVPAGVNQDYRDSGLSHLLVIAGLHMTLVTGFVFFAVRGALALIPSLALGQPIKKWAALAALGVALLYLVISGAAVPTQRAFSMVALGLVAILIDRLNLSMRAVAWAAGLVLVIEPVAITGVSFQMSFAAVVALVAFYETFGARLSRLRSSAGPIGRVLFHLAGIGFTTIVATLGTAAFSIYHFNRFAVFSVLANLIAVPIAGFWVMPWAFAACLLMPFGLEAVALTPMSWGIAAIEGVAHWTAALPAAVVDLPAMPHWGLVSITLGGLWLAIWQQKWRLWGLVPMLLGAFSLLTIVPPDMLVSGDGRLVALRTGGRYLLSSDRIDRLDAETWLRAAGGGTAGAFPPAGREAGEVRCDDFGCLWRAAGGTVAIARTVAALAEDCRRATLIVALVPVSRACHEATRVVDHADLRRDGATAIWLEPRVRVETANGDRGDRPWVLLPRWDDERRDRER